MIDYLKGTNKKLMRGGFTMSKKVIVLLAVVTLLVFASSAQAATIVHGNFDIDSSGCAACHITHAANAAKLLLTGNNQTEFCFDCHGSVKPKSPYDVEFGTTLDGSRFDYTAGTWANWELLATVARASYSGGFAYTYDFEGQPDDLIDPNDIAPGVAFPASTAAHNVQAISIGGSPWSTTDKIPGGSAAVTNDTFTCSSCHDPHGANSSTAGGGAVNNKRLLRHDLPARSDVDVNITIDISADGFGNMTEGTLRVTGYPDATINKWCGGCHDLLDVGKNAGSNAGADTRYRHAMGIALTTTAGMDLKLSTGTPVATGNKLICLSCHRAHGTGVTMTGVANSWTGQDYDNLPGANVSKSGKALLRLSNRDVCYNCHKAATQNTNANAYEARQAPTY